MKTIAVVDDDRAILAILRGVLEDEGFRVVAAENGEAGLRLVREEQPDLILSDVMMPVMDGIELAKKVRADPDLETPVVLMSAGREPGGDTDGLCRAFIPKPFDIDTVVEVVEEELSTCCRLARAR